MSQQLSVGKLVKRARCNNSSILLLSKCVFRVGRVPAISQRQERWVRRERKIVVKYCIYTVGCQ